MPWRSRSRVEVIPGDDRPQFIERAALCCSPSADAVEVRGREHDLTAMALYGCGAFSAASSHTVWIVVVLAGNVVTVGEDNAGTPRVSGQGR